MEEEALYFGENDIFKNAFHKNKKTELILMKYIFKEQYYLIKNHSLIKIHLNTLLDIVIYDNPFPLPFRIKLPQMSGYSKYFDNNNKNMDLLVNDKEILEKCNKICSKIKSLSKK